MTQVNLNNLSNSELLKLAESLKVLEEEKKYNKQAFLFPKSMKDGYAKHRRFMAAGKVFKERALIAGNRTGKTYTASAEMSFHLNGRYPDDWEGKVFEEPIKAWSVGKTHDTTKAILQEYLLGPRYDMGSGFIPKKDMEWDGKLHTTTKPGVPDAIQDVYVKHYTKGIFDGYSHLEFKSYVQGVSAFMGTAQHVIHLDEEPEPQSIYNECLMRTMTTNGIIMCTFTPLLGLSDVVLSFLPDGKYPVGGEGIVQEK